jgi:hypothetical protein
MIRTEKGYINPTFYKEKKLFSYKNIKSAVLKLIAEINFIRDVLLEINKKISRIIEL